MENKQIIQEIYEICMTADFRLEGHVIAEEVIDLIEKEVPALVANIEPPSGCDYGIGG